MKGRGAGHARPFQGSGYNTVCRIGIEFLGRICLNEEEGQASSSEIQKEKRCS